MCCMGSPNLRVIRFTLFLCAGPAETSLKILLTAGVFPLVGDGFGPRPRRRRGNDVDASGRCAKSVWPKPVARGSASRRSSAGPAGTPPDARGDREPRSPGVMTVRRPGHRRHRHGPDHRDLGQGHDGGADGDVVTPGGRRGPVWGPSIPAPSSSPPAAPSSGAPPPGRSASAQATAIGFRSAMSVREIPICSWRNRTMVQCGSAPASKGPNSRQYRGIQRNASSSACSRPGSSW